MFDIVICLIDSITPAFSITGVMDLIKNDKRAARARHRMMLKRVHSHLRVRHHNAVVGRVHC